VTVKKTIKKLENKESRLMLYRDTSLMLAMFFLPLGYDALFKLLMDITGSYWGADVVFYSISGCFWLAYILFTKRLNKFGKSE
jgi:hypothetical protein